MRDTGSYVEPANVIHRSRIPGLATTQAPISKVTLVIGVVLDTNFCSVPSVTVVPFIPIDVIYASETPNKLTVGVIFSFNVGAAGVTVHVAE